MSLAQMIDALALPAEARINQRIPKKLLIDETTPNAADKRQIQEGIEELNWIAALKPSNIGVPLFCSAEREYLEVAVLGLIFRPKAQAARLTELIHRAIPYPVLLLGTSLETKTCQISAAHKRFHQSEAGKFVFDEIVSTPLFALDLAALPTQAFLDSLALSHLPTQNLERFYQGFIDRIVGFTAASITNRFDLPASPVKMREMQEVIAQHTQIRAQLSALQAQALKEKQMNRRVDLNLKIKALKSTLASLNTLSNENTI